MQVQNKKHDYLDELIDMILIRPTNSDFCWFSDGHSAKDILISWGNNRFECYLAICINFQAINIIGNEKLINFAEIGDFQTGHINTINMQVNDQKQRKQQKLKGQVKSMGIFIVFIFNYFVFDVTYNKIKREIMSEIKICEEEYFYDRNQGNVPLCHQNPGADIWGNINQQSLIESKVQLTNLQSPPSSKTPKRNKIIWSLQDNTILLDTFFLIGSKWLSISQSIPNKSANEVKNRFYCCMRKLMKRIHNVQKRQKLKHRKLIDLESLMSLIEVGRDTFTFTDKRFDNINQIRLEIFQTRRLILEQAKIQDENLQTNSLQDLVRRILKIKYALKFINIKRAKRTEKIIQTQSDSLSDRKESLCLTKTQKDEELINGEDEQNRVKYGSEIDEEDKEQSKNLNGQEEAMEKLKKEDILFRVDQKDLQSEDNLCHLKYFWETQFMVESKKKIDPFLFF